MDFKLTEEQELLLESLDMFMDTCGFDDNYFAQKWQQNEPTSEFDKAFLDAGFGMLGIPEEYGGTQVDLVTMVLVAERLATRGFPTTCMGNALQIDDMLTFGSDEQKKIVFDHLLATGQSCFSLGLTEPQAGSESANLATTATHRDGKVIINGHKCFISNALESPYILLMCAEADMPGNPASMYFVPNDAPGITISQMHKIGQHTGSLCDIYLENVELPDSALVGEMGKGFAPDINPGCRWSIMARVRQLGVSMYKLTKVLEIKKDAVVIENENGRQELHADTVIIAAGAKPNNNIYEAIKDKLPCVNIIGDAVEVARIPNAVRAGYQLAASI